MNTLKLRLTIQARVSKQTLKHLGFTPCHSDIVQKLYHQAMLGLATPDIAECFVAVSKYAQSIVPYFKSQVIQGEIDRIRSNPSKPLPLP